MRIPYWLRRQPKTTEHWRIQWEKATARGDIDRANDVLRILQFRVQKVSQIKPITPIIVPDWDLMIKMWQDNNIAEAITEKEDNT